MLSTYAPIVGLFALAAAFAFFSVTVAPFVGPRRYNRAKLEAYECGIDPVDQPQPRDMPDFFNGGCEFGFEIICRAALELVEHRVAAVPAHANDEGKAELRPIGGVPPLEAGEFRLG